MCGIAAVFAYRDGAPDVDAEELTRINARMFRRGPDAGHVWVSTDRRIGLASRRLAIIDLSPDAEQPMFDASGDLGVVFNGEIYNYRELRARLEARGAVFRTNSDTEVLLHLYRRDGERMTELLRGMFAFVIWDARERRAFVARDPYGIKPLYLADDGSTVRIASQVKALLAGGAIARTVDQSAVAGFFLTGSVPEPLTWFENIRAVPAGTSAFIAPSGRSSPRTYYSIAAAFARAREQTTIASLAMPERLVREFVDESVAAHLVADVQVGAFLSGGIDSSEIVRQAAMRSARPLQATTVSFDVFENTPLQEADVAARFAAEMGADHHVERVTRDDFEASLPQIFEDMDQPTIDGVNTWFVSRAAARQGLKVALSGIGGDELFGSYPSFADVPRIHRMASLAGRIPAGQSAFRATTRALRLLRDVNPKVESIPLLGRSWGGAWLVKRGLFLPDELQELMSLDVAEDALRRLDLTAILEAPLVPDPGTAYTRVATLEASLYMRNQLLRDTDWASMAHSLEVRTPLVDAWLLRQLAPLIIQVGAGAKRALSARLPPYIAAAPKRGFVTPIAQWSNLAPDGTGTRMRSWARVVAERVY